MDILPAIDLRDGQVVRLQQGDYDRQRTYHSEPAEVARQFADAGVRWIHVVDLDAARSGRPANLPAVEAIAAAAGVKIELGGGARNHENIARMLAAGADRVVVGSAAMKDWAWFSQAARSDELAGKLVLGLDARNGQLAAEGWTEQTALTAEALAAEADALPLAAIVYTDIARDGMLGGANVEATAAVVHATALPVIASGGVSTVEDVIRCRQAGCAGAIIGKAWYEGRIDLVEAIAAAED